MDANDILSEKNAKRTPVYADVLKELKRHSANEKELLCSLPLAPMQTGLGSMHLKDYKASSRRKPEPVAHTPNAIHERSRKSLKEGAKRLKTIEDHMWQHRQEERDLKRTEADILRQQKQMEKNMKQYQDKLSRLRADEVKNFLDKESNFTHFCQKDLHEKEKATKDKIQHSNASKQKFNEETKKFMKSVNELSYRYQNLMDVLERKRTEMEQLSEDFERRVREKEEEQLSLKKELASLAIKMNMEAQKKRHQQVDAQREKNQSAMKGVVESNEREGTMSHEKASIELLGARHEEQQWKLDQAMNSKKESIRAKQRQEGRNLADVRTQMKQKLDLQHYIQQEAEDMQLNMLGEEIQKRVDIADAKRRNRLETLQQQMRNKNSIEFSNWSKRAIGLENEAKKRKREDRLKQLSKFVANQDQKEHSLYSSAKDAESLRKKQAQLVEALHNDLKSLKIENSRKLKQAAVEAQITEQQLQQKISRELAELSKAVNTREECMRLLTVQKSRAREERRIFEEERKEYLRRGRIAKQTDVTISNQL